MLILAGIFLWPGGLYAQSTGNLPSLETPRYEIRQMGKGEPWYDPLRGGRVRFTFVVNDIIAGRENTFVLDNLSSEIKRLLIFGEKLLVIGEEATSRAAVITLVSLRDGVVEDTIMGFSPEFSPGRRYVIFKKYFSPKAADPPKRSDLVLLYDLNRSADENRIRGLKAYRNDPLGLLTEVGRPVFPDINARKKRYRVWVREEAKRHSILPGGFFWPDGEKQVAFIDRVGHSFYFVVIETDSLEKQPSLHRAEFDPRVDDEGDNEGGTGRNNPPVLRDRFTLEKVKILESGEIEIDLSDRKGEGQTWQFPPEAFVPPLFP